MVRFRTILLLIPILLYPFLSPSSSDVGKVRSRISRNLIQNHEFCDLTMAFWDLDSRPGWEASGPKSNNPSSCLIAAKWHTNMGAPLGIPGFISQKVADPFCGDHTRVLFSTHFVGLGVNEMAVSLYRGDDLLGPWEFVTELLNKNPTGGVWAHSGDLIQMMPDPARYYKIEIMGIQYQYNPPPPPSPGGFGVKLTGIVFQTIDSRKPPESGGVNSPLFP